MARAVLALEGVSKSFGALRAVDDVTLDLRPGEIHALIGPNGAGKSTLIALTAGNIMPDAGRIFLGGEDVTRLSTSARARRGLGRTFQVSSLAPEFTALQNTVLGALGRTGRPYGFFRPVMRDRELLDMGAASLERVGLADRATVLCAELSHGERRRLELAVALTLSPRVFLMDEPMAGLGPEGTSELTGLLDSLRVRAPILLVEHDMDTVFALADRVSVVVSGRIVATGSPQEIRADPTVRSAYLGADAEETA